MLSLETRDLCTHPNTIGAVVGGRRGGGAEYVRTRKCSCSKESWDMAAGWGWRAIEETFYSLTVGSKTIYHAGELNAAKSFR